MDRGQDLGWLCDYMKALALCASWELPAAVLTHFWRSRLLAVLMRIQLVLCSAVEVLLSYKHSSRAQGCIFSPGFIFNIGTCQRKGQQCSAVFSGVSA